MSIRWTNNAASVLASDITAGSLSITVTTGHGDRFPEVASPHYFMATLVDTSGNREIVKVTARTSGSNTMTITRAQEGTSARSFATGSVVELRITKNAMDLFSRSVDIHENHYVVDASAADQGATTNSRSLKSLVDALGATEEATLELPHTGTGDTTTYTVGTNLTIPATVTLRAHKGVRISPSTGVTLTVNGIVQAGAFQIFAGDGTVTVSTYPQDQAWWGSAQRLDAKMNPVLGSDADGDIYYRASGALARLAKGTALQTLQMNSGATGQEWAASPQSVLTAGGDILYASAANTLARLAKGTPNQRLYMNAAGTAPEWGSWLKMGAGSHDVSATGTQDITGVGFTPSLVILLCGVSGAAKQSIGFDCGTVNYCLYNNNAIVTSAWEYNNSYSIHLVSGAGVEAFAKVTTLGSDGFTLTWAKNGSPTGTATILYIALR